MRTNLVLAAVVVGLGPNDIRIQRVEASSENVAIVKYLPKPERKHLTVPETADMQQLVFTANHGADPRWAGEGGTGMGQGEGQGAGGNVEGDIKFLSHYHEQRD